MKHREFIEEWVNVLGLDHENNAKIEQFDDRKYRFSLYLLNQDGFAIKLRKGSITELFIEDNIMNWFHTGSVTVLNPDDIIERAESIFLGDSINDEPVTTVPYRFRGDCRDLLLLTFEPHIDPGDVGEVIPETLNSMVYTIKFLFTIYATEDIISGFKSFNRKSQMEE